MTKRYIRHASELVTCKGPAPKKGKDMADIGLIYDGGVLIHDDKIFAVGTTEELDKMVNLDEYEVIDASGKKDSDIYKKAAISKQLFSKIINDPDARPTKPTAIALALALELNLAETRDLIGRAGFALTNSSTFDLIIRYFIEHKQFNVIEINIALYEFDQSLLGA